MVPDSFTAFFAASAGVAGALIGLLFVAISVAPEAPPGAGRLEIDVRAGVAFSALTDALVVSLFALIPGAEMGAVAVVVASAGLATTLALVIVLARTSQRSHPLRLLRLLVAQALVFVLQLLAGLQLSSQPHRVSNVRTLAVLTVVFFLVGIARAWQLIGARETGLFHVVGTVIRDRAESSAGEAVGAPTGRTGDGPGADPDARD